MGWMGLLLCYNSLELGLLNKLCRMYQVVFDVSWIIEITRVTCSKCGLGLVSLTVLEFDTSSRARDS